MQRYVKYVIYSICLIIICAEIFLRYAGFGSYPVYDLDQDMKYIPAANQHGLFLNRNSWFLNNRHMGNIENWSTEKHPNILLLGNSIVFGGLHFTHEEKLGPLLEKNLGPRYVVWSAAANGWTNLNEIAYIDNNSDVLQNADVVVLEYMSGGLSTFAPWPGYYIFPDHKPFILTSYIFQKYVLPLFLGKHVNEYGSLPPVGQTEEGNLRRFNALVSSIVTKRKLVIFLYPTKAELLRKEGWTHAIAPVQETCKAQRFICVDLAREKTWTVDSYKDDGIHPTVAGNKTLAAVLAACLK